MFVYNKRYIKMFDKDVIVLYNVVVGHEKGI
nr:MAG TPA: hypothetical protein [Bacteriophage sp.]